MHPSCLISSWSEVHRLTEDYMIAIVKPQHENVHDNYSDAEMKESQNNILAQIQQNYVHAALNAKMGKQRLVKLF